MTLVLSPIEIVKRREAEGRLGLLAKAEGWSRVRLGDHCKIVNGAPFPSRQFNRSGRGLPLIRIRDVGQDSSDTYFEGEYEDVHLVNPGDLLIGMDGDFRLARWAGKTALLNQRVCKIIIDSEILHERFVEFVLPGYLEAIWQETSSVTVKHLSSKSVQEIPVPVPSLEEQDEIVRILEEQFSRLDAAAASIAAVRRKAARLRASFFKAALSGALSPPDEADAWELTSIGEIAEFGRKPPKDLLEANSEVSFVPMACVEEESGRIQLDQTIGAAEGKRRSLTYFEEGDVLFAKITPCMENGKVAIAKGLRIGAAFGSSEFYVLQPLASRVRPEFLNNVLVDPNFRGIAARAMTGAVGQQRVPRKFIEDFEILIPPLRSQDAIIAMLKSQFSRIESALLASEVIQEKLLATRRSLLHAAFSGELTKEWREKNNG